MVGCSPITQSTLLENCGFSRCLEMLTKLTGVKRKLRSLGHGQSSKACTCHIWLFAALILLQACFNLEKKVEKGCGVSIDFCFSL